MPTVTDGKSLDFIANQGKNLGTHYGKRLLKDYLQYRRVITGLGGGMMGSMLTKDDSIASQLSGMAGGIGGSFASAALKPKLPSFIKIPSAMLLPIASGYATSRAVGGLLGHSVPNTRAGN